jgi:rhodanese-related sulfurtransferase
MPEVVDRHELRRLIDEHRAQLVEVLPTDEYDEEHLPGAVNLALKQLNAEVATRCSVDTVPPSRPPGVRPASGISWNPVPPPSEPTNRWRRS